MYNKIENYIFDNVYKYESYTMKTIKQTVNDRIEKSKITGKLDLSKLYLATIPDSIGLLTNLTELSLYSNQLTTLPDWIGNLTNLTE